MKKGKFSKKTLDVVDAAKKVISEWQEGKPTMMNIFNALKINGGIEPSKQGYKRLVTIIGNARKAGLIGWDDIYGTKQPRGRSGKEA